MTDYLWDRSGEPDKDIQQLEELLGPLGYQPKPLEIPATLRPGRRLNLYPVLAIAAAVALVALALGIWLSINRDAAVAPVEAKATPVPVEKNNKVPESALLPEKTIPAPREPDRKPRLAVTVKRHAAGNQLASNERRRRQNSQPQTEMTAVALEAEAGKEQLMLALRLASSKLNLAQKRAQGGYPVNLIRNQHKVG